MLRKSLLDQELLTKKSFWIRWRRLGIRSASGGLDHVLASGEDITRLYLDTEVYFQHRWSVLLRLLPACQVAQFAAAGKDIKQKNLLRLL